MELAVYIFLTFLGVLSHFLKKAVKGESVGSIVRYFKSHFKSTLLMVIGAIIGFFLLKEFGQLGYFSCFSVGYMADSIFNKAEVQGAKLLK